MRGLALIRSCLNSLSLFWSQSIISLIVGARLGELMSSFHMEGRTSSIESKVVIGVGIELFCYLLVLFQ